jgi:serine/threonine protein kinase
MALSIGQTLRDRYRIDSLLGQGGMGAVYEALDLSLNVRCAIKENLIFTETAIRQFEREARLLAALRHSNLPRVTDHFAVPGQGQYLVMDFIEGENLDQRMRWLGPPPEGDVRRWAYEILGAVEHLHQRNIVHRDIKPANIKITPDGHAILVDFGIAKEIGAAGSATTTTGARGLTPGFAPPEQYGFGQSRTDARSDIYAFGATLYALLANEPPVDAFERFKKPEEFVPLSSRPINVSRAMAEAIDRALSMAQEDRFQSADEMKAALRGRTMTQASVAVSPTIQPGTTSQPKTPIVETKINPATPETLPPQSASAAKLGSQSTPAETPATQTNRSTLAIWGCLGLMGLAGLLVVIGVVGVYSIGGINWLFASATPPVVAIATAPSTDAPAQALTQTPGPTSTRPPTLTSTSTVTETPTPPLDLAATEEANVAASQTIAALIATQTVLSQQATALSDVDGDGWTYAQEIARGTDPTKRDTDGDGLVDSADPDPLRLPTPTFTPTRTSTPTRTPTSTSVLCTERVSLYSWWSPSREDNFATTNPAWAGKSGDTRSPDYVFVRLEGLVCNPDTPQPPGTVALYSWWSPSRGDNFTTTNPAWAGKSGDTRLPDYVFVRLEGYVYSPDTTQLLGMVALYSWWSPSREDNFATTNPTWAGKSGDTRLPDYGFARLEGYLIP